MANNKDFEKDFKLPDTKALSEAYTEYLDSVTFGGKPIGKEKKKPEAVSTAKVDETEKSSTVHDEIVEKIVRKLKILGLYKKLRKKMLRKRLPIMRSLSHFPKRKIT